MKVSNELNEVSTELLKYWLENDIRKDFNFFELFVKVATLNYQYPRMISEYEKDIEIAKLMTYIERQYKVPMLSINIETWLKQDTLNEFIFNIYTKLSDMRNL